MIKSGPIHMCGCAQVHFHLNDVLSNCLEFQREEKYEKILRQGLRY